MRPSIFIEVISLSSLFLSILDGVSKLVIDVSVESVYISLLVHPRDFISQFYNPHRRSFVSICNIHKICGPEVEESPSLTYSSRRTLVSRHFQLTFDRSQPTIIIRWNNDLTQRSNLIHKRCNKSN